MSSRSDSAISGFSRSVTRRRWRSTAVLCALAMVGSVLVGTGPVAAAPLTAQTATNDDVIGGLDDLTAAAAPPGSLLAPGTYEISSTLQLGAGQSLVAEKPGQTTVRFVGTRDSVIEVTGQDVTISGITITGGSNTNGNGGGIAVARNASLTLIDSTVTDNTAREGGGINNDGTLVVERSTFDNNTAGRKGGGLRDNGMSTITNSTFVANTASQGGAISTTGSTTITHATIVRNQSTSSSSAGVDRNGGTIEVLYSIIGANTRNNGSPASDCSGTPDLIGLNLVTDDSGCNPVGPILLAENGDVGPLNIGPLGDNGGPTETVALLDGSAALDAVALTDETEAPSCVSGLAQDQRGSDRPFGTGCDLGAYERGRLGVDVDLAVDTDNYSFLGLDNTVEVGVTSVPTDAIVGELAARTTVDDNGTVDASGLRRIGLRRIDIGDLGASETVDENGDPLPLTPSELKAIGLRRISLESIGLRRIGLRRIDIQDAGLRRIGLPTIPLSEIPLLLDGGWEALLTGTTFDGVPLQSITLEDISGTDADGNPIVSGLDDLTLQSLDLSSTGLRRISLPSILLTEFPLEAVQIGDALPDDENYAQRWCESLFGTEACTGSFVDEVGGAELWEAQLAGADVETDDVFGVPLDGLTATGLRRIDIADAGLRRIGLRRIFLENTGLRRIELRDIGLRRIDLDGDGEDDGIESIIDCSPVDGIDPCSTDETNTLTLGDIAAGCVDPEDGTSAATCRLRAEVTVGELLDLLGVEDAAGISLLDGLSLYDLIFAFVPPEDVPWETIDLDRALLQNVAVPPQPTFDYVTTVSVTEGPADLDVSLFLPPGFAVAAAPNADAATWCSTTDGACLNEDPKNEVVPNTPLELGLPTYSIDDVPTGEYVLRVPVRAGLSTGDASQFETNVSVDYVESLDPNGEVREAEAGPVGVNVVQAASGGPGRAPILDDGQLQLGHIGSSDDVDLYSFTTPDDAIGASARILLSNIPSGVDYDLSVYGPRPTSLRNPPTQTLNSLGDVDFDLDPSDDALSTDLANDIAIDINVLAADIDELNLVGDYALRDIASRRSNNDEEVTLAALEENAVYVVAVTGYYGDLSTEPYGLRVRLDRRSALPPCAATIDYPAAAPSAEVPASLRLDADTNTLYVTNAARLDAEAALDATDSADVIDAIAGTEGVNGVDAALLLVDELGAFDAWNDDSCDPDLRNNVVRQIGTAIDSAVDYVEAALGSIENLVIVGGDGVIPMAAVPDLTEYSNEATFAREVLSNAGFSNAASGALGNGYLLSDDPYATDAGISILGGDHELYVPQRNIGRLVETADEIVGQLTNFADEDYNGLLDPTTFSAAASVTGYDFLDDGAQAIIDALDTDGPFDATNSLLGPAWDNNAFLGLFAGGADYSVISPNAHYDYESLLPAAADTAGYFTDEQLVTTADVDDLETPPIDSLIFTVGCHAGFSVSDVQLGMTGTLDWAQLYTSTGNQYVAHTTYGYGDTDIVAYSERLAALFAENVAAMAADEPGAPASLGAAVRLAKQQYLDGTLVLTPYDEKILQSWTYYGLPMYDLGPIVEPAADGETTGTSSFAAAFGATSLDVTSSSLGDPVSTGPVTFAFDDAVDGIVPVAIDLNGDALELNTTEPDEGSYYSVDGKTIVAQYRTVQPLVDVAIPTDDESVDEYGGFLITDLVTQDLLPDYVPFVSRPLIDNSTDETRVVVDDSAFPATLQRIGDAGSQQRLLVAAGQYEENQRLFREIRGELLPRTGTNDVPSRFIDVSGQTVSDVGTSGRGVQFDIVTDDAATRVVVVFREVGANEWRSVELAGTSVTDGSTRWFGSAPLNDPDADVEFFVQNANDSGAVGITSRKIENFLTTDAVDPDTGLAIVYTGGEDGQSNGRFFASGARFEVTPAAATTKFSVDSGEPDDYNPATGISVVFDPERAGEYDPTSGTVFLDRGAHVLFAEDESGARVYRFFILDPAPPQVSTSVDGVQVTITAVDSSSGVKSIFQDCGEACGIVRDFAVGEDGTATLVIEYTGSDDITIGATATDNVGNVSGQVTTSIDRTPPTVTISADPAGWTSSDVEVTITATDPSGVETIAQDCEEPKCEILQDVTFAADGTATLKVQSKAEGVTTIAATATDGVGNTSAPVTAKTYIDRVAPTTSLVVTPDPSVTPGPDMAPLYVVGETITVTFTCSDTAEVGGPEQSGIQTCQLLDGTEVVADAGAAGSGTYDVDTTGPGTHSFSVTATDEAGNSSLPTDPISVVVAYDTCLLYDDTQEKNIGSNYTITVQLCDKDGNNVSSRDITLTALTIDGEIVPGPNFQGNSNNGFVFRFTRSASAYTYNLDTTGLEPLPSPHFLYFTTEAVPDTDDVAVLQALATNAAPFRLR